MRTRTSTGDSVCAAYASAGEGHYAQASEAPAPRCSFRRSRALNAHRDNPRGTGQCDPWKVNHTATWRFYALVSK